MPKALFAVGVRMHLGNVCLATHSKNYYCTIIIIWGLFLLPFSSS